MTSDVLPIGRHRRFGVDSRKIEIRAGRERLQRARNVDKLLRDASAIGVDHHVCKEESLWLKETESDGIVVEEGWSERGFPAWVNEVDVDEVDSERAHEVVLRRV